MTLQPLFNYSLLFKSLFSKKKFTSNILLKSGRMAFNHILSTKDSEFSDMAKALQNGNIRQKNF